MPPDQPRNPFEGVTDYFSELNRMRQTGVHGREAAVEDRERTHASAWVPTTDIYARADDLVIVMEVAGVAPDDIDLRLRQGVLTVSGSRSPSPHAEDGDHYYVRERFYGAFRRAVTLPDGTEPGDISAVFDEGLVEVTVAGGAVHADGGRIELGRRGTPATRRTLG